MRLHELPMNDRRNMAFRARLGHAPVVATGWPWQCRCGTMCVVRYRGYRCCRCGTPFYSYPNHPVTGHPTGATK